VKTDDEAEKRFVNSILEGIQEYVQTIELEKERRRRRQRPG
jgi:hypothetical protein